MSVQLPHACRTAQVLQKTDGAMMVVARFPVSSSGQNQTACVGLHAAATRVSAANLTGQPTEQDFMRCAVAVYKMGDQASLPIYMTSSITQDILPGNNSLSELPMNFLAREPISWIAVVLKLANQIFKRMTMKMADVLMMWLRV
jgi:hypothetical protein